MTSEESERMRELCKQIAVEKDPEIFRRLAGELKDRVELEHQRILAEREPTVGSSQPQG